MSRTESHHEDKTVGLPFVRSSFFPEYPGSKDVLTPLTCGLLKAGKKHFPLFLHSSPMDILYWAGWTLALNFTEFLPQIMCSKAMDLEANIQKSSRSWVNKHLGKTFLFLCLICNFNSSRNSVKHSLGGLGMHGIGVFLKPFIFHSLYSKCIHKACGLGTNQEYSLNHWYYLFLDAPRNHWVIQEFPIWIATHTLCRLLWLPELWSLIWQMNSNIYLAL